MNIGRSLSTDGETDLPETSFWRDTDLPGVEIRFSRYRSACFVKHAHETFSVGVIEGGTSSFFCRDVTRRITTGETAIIPPGEIHACNPEPGADWVYKMFYIDPDRLRTAAEEMIGEGEPGFPEPVVRDADLSRRFLHLFDLVRNGAGRLEKECSLSEVVEVLLVRHSVKRVVRRPAREPGAVRMVREYIDDNLSCDISLRDLSGVAGIGPFHLIRLFRKAVGAPPHAYLIRRRVQRAREMLLGGRSIVDIALETGFSDQSHFTRAFKGAVGITPRRYRKAVITVS